LQTDPGLSSNSKREKLAHNARAIRIEGKKKEWMGLSAHGQYMDPGLRHQKK
jgi:hypothetical protein